MGSKTIATILTLKDQFTPKLRQVTNNVQRSTKEMKTMQRQMKQGQNTLNKFGTNALDAAKKIGMVGAAAAIVSVKLAMDFEKGMRKVNTIANLNNTDLGKLGKETLKLSDATGVTAKDLTEMEYNALSSAVAIEDLIGVTKASADLSKGGFGDANEALKLLTSTYNVYRDTFQDANINQVKASIILSDKMIQIQNLGVTTVGELSSALGLITPIAKAANLSFDELGGGMIALTKNGLSTGEATTSLKAMLSNIIKPSEQARQAAKALGIDYSLAAIKSKGFGGFMLDIKEKIKKAAPALLDASNNVALYQKKIDGATKEQKKNKTQMRDWKNQLSMAKKELKSMSKAGGSGTGALAQLFGSVEALNGVLTLVSNTGMEDYKSGLKGVQDSTGSTKKTVDEMNQSSLVKFEKSLNHLKNVGIEIGEKALPSVVKVLEKVSIAIDWCKQNASWLLPVTAGLISAFAGFAIISSVVGFFKSFIVVTKGAAGAQTVFNFALSANPIGAVAMAIGLLVAAGVALYMNWDKVSKVLSTVWGSIKSTFATGVNWVIDKINILRGALNLPLIAKVRMDLASVKNSASKANGMEDYSNGKAVKKHNVGRNANGTSYFKGGLTQINERGPEMINLPSGSQVIPADKTKKKMSKLSKPDVYVYVAIQGNVIGNEQYADDMGNTIIKKIKTALANS